MTYTPDPAAVVQMPESDSAYWQRQCRINHELAELRMTQLAEAVALLRRCRLATESGYASLDDSISVFLAAHGGSDPCGDATTSGSIQ